MKTGRTLTHRLHLKGELVADSGLRVGSAATDGILADLDVVRDLSGRLILPGTSLTGVLRDWARRAVTASDDRSPLSHAWAIAYGEDPEAADGLVADDRPFARGEGAAASLLTVHDATATETIRVEVRDHVAIERQHNTARDRGKYDAVVVPAGTRFQLHLVLEVRVEQEFEASLRLISGLAAALESGHLHLGAASSRGLGRVRLDDSSLTVEDLSTADGVLAALRARRTGVGFNRQERSDRPLEGADPVRVRIAWHALGSVLVRDGHEGLGVRTLPLTATVGALRYLVLPGSSIKGALRAHAERIVRTVARIETVAEDAERSDLRLVDRLFGSARGTEKDSPGARSLLAVEDCYSEHGFTPEQWHAVAAAPDLVAGQIAARALGVGQKVMPWAVARPHVAIDRWTGGASDQKLFSVLEPRGVSWGPVELRLDAAGLDEAERLQAGALLLLILRDLEAGDLPLGGLVNRGHGDLLIDEIALTGAEVLGLAPDGPFSPTAFTPGEPMLAAWRDAATTQEVSA